MPIKPRVEEELAQIVDEIVHEARVECITETMRRGLQAPMAMGLTASSMLANAVATMYLAHKEVPQAESFSKATMHKYLDEFWDSCTPRGDG